MNQNLFSTLLAMADCYPNCSCELVEGAFLGLSAAFWTSTGYLIAAIAIYSRVKIKSFELEFWTFICITLSISSMLFHSLYIKSTLAMDYASITLALSFFSLLATFKKRITNPRLAQIAFIFFFFLLWGIFLLLGKEERIILSLSVFTYSLWEIKSKIRRHPTRDRRYLLSSVGLLLVAFSCFLLEEIKWWCDPSDFIQGHTVWHLGSAGGVYLFGRWRFQR